MLSFKNTIIGDNLASKCHHTRRMKRRVSHDGYPIIRERPCLKRMWWQHLRYHSKVVLQGPLVTHRHPHRRPPPHRRPHPHTHLHPHRHPRPHGHQYTNMHLNSCMHLYTLAPELTHIHPK